MTREGKRPLAALLAAVLAAALLAACGGSDSSGSNEATATGSTTTSQSGGSKQGPPSSQGKPQNKGQDRGASQDAQSEGGGSHPKNVAAPLEVSGGGSAQFQVKGGDNSIQEYGEEGEESELQEVAEIVHGFYVARAEEKWATACSYLASSNIEQLKQLVSQSPEFKNAGCEQALAAFTRSVPASVDREITTIDAGSFRHEGEQGFLIYYGAGHIVYAMPLRNEGGAWKVAALSGSALS